MAVPEREPETGGRSLAEILREAGVDSPTRMNRRRRWDEMEDTGVRQRGAGDGGAASSGSFGRRASDLDASGPIAARPGRPAVPEAATAAIPGLRPSRTPSVPATASTPAQTRVSAAAQTKTAAPAPVRGRHSGEQRAVRPPVDSHPSTGPIPIVRADGAGAADLEPAPRESALAWLRFAGELVIALAAGIGIYFAFTVLWEMLPHAAVLLAPLGVTGLVAGVGAWRHRQGREPIGVRLLAVLVFAGTLLTIAPAAGLLAAY